MTAGPGEEAGAVAEQLGHDQDQDLVEQPGREALAGDVGAEDVHVASAGGLTRRCDARLEVRHEGGVGHRFLGRRVGEHE